MIKGFYAAAAALVANLTRQNMLSHNLANVDTPGFKQILVALDDFLYTREMTAPGEEPGRAQRIQGATGLGVETVAPITDYAEGALRQTGQPLDVAITGEGFFRIGTPEGERYTRDGRFIRDANGGLVTVDGYSVLDTNGQPITVPDGQIAIQPDGSIVVNGAQVAQLGLVAFTDPADQLTRDLPNLFAANGAPTGTATGTLQQGFLEQANVNPAQLMTQMVAVGRAYEAAQQMVRTQDELTGRAISTLSRL
jgi:flagellar basal-body rod protein FlgF